jgi:hypothetical protein
MAQQSFIFLLLLPSLFSFVFCLPFHFVFRFIFCFVFDFSCPSFMLPLPLQLSPTLIRFASLEANRRVYGEENCTAKLPIVLISIIKLRDYGRKHRPDNCANALTVN